MKKINLTLALAMVLTLGMNAQDDMTTVWEFKAAHKVPWTGTGLEGEVSYGADPKNITVFKNEDGSAVWTGAWKELTPNLRKVDELIPFWESDLLFLFDRKLGADQIAVMDLNTGKVMWNTDKYQNIGEDNIVYIPEKDGFAISLKESIVFIDAKTGEEKWETSKFKGVVGKYVYMDDGSLVMVNFQPSGLAAFFTGFKNQIVRINMDNGDVIWDQTYRGRAERKVVTRDFVFNLYVEEGKVFLNMNGLQVYDLKTGSQLWAAAYDFTPKDYVKNPAIGPNLLAMGVYGAVAEPLIVGDDVYVLEMSNKRNQFIKKYDLKSGRLLWTSDEVPDGKVIPAMYMIEDRIVIQVGGVVEAQAIFWQKDAQGNKQKVWKVWYPSVKPFGVQGYDVNTGKLVWQSEKFKKGITNVIQVENDIIVSSGKALYKINYKDGTEEYEVDVKGDGVGLAQSILAYKDKIAVIGAKGITTHFAKDGKLANASKYKASSLEEEHGNIVIMKTAKADIACFDLEDCTFKEFKAKTGAITTLSVKGDFVYVYEPNKRITKLSTQ